MTNAIVNVGPSSNDRAWIPTLIRNAILLIALFSNIAIVKMFFQALKLPDAWEHYQLFNELNRNRSSSNGCIMPVLDPWDPSIIEFYSKPKPLRCRSLQANATVLSPDGFLRPNEIGNKLRCRYRIFAHNTGVDDAAPRYDAWKSLPESGVRIDGDFVEVECSHGFLKTYRNHFSQIVKRSVSLISNKTILDADIIRHPSVLIFGLDSMSRSNFIRQLPETHAQMQTMGFVDMLGHVKIGDNSYVNWVAILAGKRATMTRASGGNIHFQKPEFSGELKEDWELDYGGWDNIWKRYSNASYATLFAEDRPNAPTFNNYQKSHGFLNPPTDHYYRPYWTAISNTLLKKRSTSNCYGETPDHVAQLNYLWQFLKNYAGKRHFAWHWLTDISHDYLNTAGVADNDFAEFFRGNEKLFNETIVFVVSDHGHRYDHIRKTMIGRLEARMPYLAVRVPPRMRARYPNLEKRLRDNSAKMTTQFDIHETLLNILQGNFDDLFERQPLPSGNRAYSILQRMPDHRSCYESNVPEDYCPCLTEHEIPVASAIEPATAIIDHLNKLIENSNTKMPANQERCLKLELDAVTYASVRVPPRTLISDPQVRNTLVSTDGVVIKYRIVLRARPPSNALLETVVTKQLESGKTIVSEEIERNNRYGNISHCVTDETLKKICHCINAKT